MIKCKIVLLYSLFTQIYYSVCCILIIKFLEYPDKNTDNIFYILQYNFSINNIRVILLFITTLIVFIAYIIFTIIILIKYKYNNRILSSNELNNIETNDNSLENYDYKQYYYIIMPDSNDNSFAIKITK